MSEVSGIGTPLIRILFIFLLVSEWLVGCVGSWFGHRALGDGAVACPAARHPPTAFFAPDKCIPVVRCPRTQSLEVADVWVPDLSTCVGLLVR